MENIVCKMEAILSLPQYVDDFERIWTARMSSKFPILGKQRQNYQGASQYKDVLPVWDPHVKDKTVSRPSDL